MPRANGRRGNGRPPRETGPNERVLDPAAEAEFQAAITPELRERIDATAREKLGATIDEVVPPGDIRDMLYRAFVEALQREPRPIPKHTMEFVERCRAAGLVVTPGAGPKYLREPLSIPGLEGRSILTEAILEERYGPDWDK